MTVSAAVTEWLKSYEGGFELTDAISTDLLEGEPEAYGVFKAPGGNIEEFVDGSRDATVNYLFLARQPSQTDSLRKDAHEWLEGLEGWIWAQNMRRNLPDMGAGRTCFGVSVTSSYTAEEQSDAEITYQLMLAINYFEEART
jgi:hypothetical protein